jgi:hypothetical protein
VGFKPLLPRRLFAGFSIPQDELAGLAAKVLGDDANPGGKLEWA